jgi:hypothetical protein
LAPVHVDHARRSDEQGFPISRLPTSVRAKPGIGAFSSEAASALGAPAARPSFAVASTPKPLLAPQAAHLTATKAVVVNEMLPAAFANCLASRARRFLWRSTSRADRNHLKHRAEAYVAAVPQAKDHVLGHDDRGNAELERRAAPNAMAA